MHPFSVPLSAAPVSTNILFLRGAKETYH